MLLERIISLVAPHSCLVCGREGSLVCVRCLPDAITPLPSRCYRCKKVTQDHAVCVADRRKSYLKHVWVASEYDELPKQLIHKLKFEHAPAARFPVASLIVNTLPYLPPETIVTHIPTATSRRRQRGYDHGELLAKAVAAKLHLRHLPLLARTGQTRQVGSRRSERLDQLKTAYYIPKPYLLEGHSILLIDDITTTGATLESAAKELKRAGAKRIDAAVFAQKV